MRLLGWYQLESKNDTAVLRYTSPVRVFSIRIFPTGAQPFSLSPDIVARTHPEAFFMKVFFNIYTTAPHSQSQDKRAGRKIAPTMIAYVGGQAEFTVDMGQDHATRLIIFHGKFQSLFVAVYGDTVAEPPDITAYDIKALPISQPVGLSKSVDPANSKTPTLLAEQLLTIIPQAPPLPLVSRLTFSLKPESNAWDDPNFPYIFATLEDDGDKDLAALVKLTSSPIADETSIDSLNKFAIRLQAALGSNPADEDAYNIAKLLTRAASQRTVISEIFLERIEFTKVFNEQALEENTILCLLDAVANIEIARHMSNDAEFVLSLEKLRCNPATEKLVQKALKKLLMRLQGWKSFEDALTNPNGNFTASAEFLKDIAMEDHSLGCWLECMINHETFITNLGSPNDRSPLPPLLFDLRPPDVCHEDFLLFVRAFLGVSTVLAVFAWADSIGNTICRERALAILILWQGIDGYREIVNHSLLIKQLARRLLWNTGDVKPLKSGIFAERLILGLTMDPRAMLRENLFSVVLNLKPPFVAIQTEELNEIVKLALVARDGLQSAVDELAYTGGRPFSLRRLRVFRISFAILEEEVGYEDGEWNLLDCFWSEHCQGLFPTLISMLYDIANDLNSHFAVAVPTHHMNPALPDLLFRSADDLLHLLARFTPTYQVIGRDLRILTAAAVDLYVCSVEAKFKFSASSSAYLAAKSIRQSSCQVLWNFVNPDPTLDSGDEKAGTVLRAILDRASLSAGRDPARHIRVIYDLIDNILPDDLMSQDGELPCWTNVFPVILHELKVFCRFLDPGKRVAFLQRLVRLDNGVTGVGEWLFMEEMKHLSTTLHELSSPLHGEDFRLVMQYEIFSLITFCELLLASPMTSNLVVSSFSTNVDMSQILESCISLILHSYLSSPTLTKLTRQLANNSSDLDPNLQFNILLLSLRNAQNDPSVKDALEFVPEILSRLPSSAINAEALQKDVGRVISAYSADAVTADSAEKLLLTLEWLASHVESNLSTLVGLSAESFHRLCSSLRLVLPADRKCVVDDVKSKLSIDEDEVFTPTPVVLPESLMLSVKSIEKLISPSKPSEPSTPKRGNKTPDILGVVISPPTALLRSPAATGLTKTYANNDFRQLRQVPSTRLNTSRMPSTHVDEFEGSPEMLPDAMILDGSASAAGYDISGLSAE